MAPPVVATLPLHAPDTPKEFLRTVRVVHISDTHRELDVAKVEATHKEAAAKGLTTILIHSGDFTYFGDGDSAFLGAFANLPHNHKVLVCGNHDRPGMSADFASRCAQKKIILLHDKGVVLEGISMYGFPWGYHGPAWSLAPDDLNKCIGNIPEHTDVLVTHMPPRLILDLAWVNSTVRPGAKYDCKECGQEHQQRYAHWGHPYLRQVIETRGIKLHCFGHVHDDSGLVGGAVQEGGKIGTMYSNASEKGRQGKRAPHIIDLIVDTRRWAAQNQSQEQGQKLDSPQPMSE